MCGINGFNFSDEELIGKMNNKIKHRGPDDSGVYVDPSAGSGQAMSLGHQRLSIIDLSERGHQPMEDEKCVIVFNGEIYNFKEIKKDLSDYNFKSETDTEVILAAYEKWGVDCLKKFNGIFAFAVWDKERKELFLARDRVGVKPLYYYNNGNKFVFSSEIKAILEYTDIKREVDIEALNHYFRVLYVPGPLTMFKGIKKLETGTYLTLKDEAIKIERYWDIADAKLSKGMRPPTLSLCQDFGRQVPLRWIKNYENAKSEINKLMLDAVKMQLVSDRPLGVFLSGGIDSTSVLGNMVKLGHEKIKTFSVGFDVDDSQNKINVDFNLARLTAKHYKTDHHELLISSKDIRNNIEEVSWHLDEPIANINQTATYLLSKYAKNEVAVVLGGDGGDELFGGYERYRLSRLMSRLGFLTKFGKIFGKRMDYPKGVLRYAKFMFQDEREVNRVLRGKINNDKITKEFYKKRYFDTIEKDFENQFMKTDFGTWLVDESLMRTDKMTMAFGLEQRVPILDQRLVELAYRIPSKMKLGIFKNQTKLIWKEAMNEFLPQHVKRSAQKKVWLTPMSEWLRTDLKDWAKEVLSKDYADTSDYINLDEVGKMFREHCDKKKYNLNLIWACIMFQLWYRRYSM